MNSSAKTYSGFHIKCSGDSQFYSDKNTALRTVFYSWISEYEDKIDSTNSEILELELSMKSMSKSEIQVQSIDNLDYDQLVYYYQYDRDPKIYTTKVEKKVFNKSGLVYLIADNDATIMNCNPSYLRLIAYNEGDRYSDGTEFKGFINEESINAYLNNLNYYNLETKIKNLKNNLINCKKRIHDLNTKLSTLSD